MLPHGTLDVLNGSLECELGSVDAYDRKVGPVLIMHPAQKWEGAPAVHARRLFAESVALILAERETSQEFNGLPELVVQGLSDGDARALLASVVHGPLDETVRERIVAESRGNPLALLELPREHTSAELAGGFGLPRRDCSIPNEALIALLRE